MDKLAEPPKQNPAYRGRKWLWAMAAVLGVAFLVLLLLGLPRLIAVYQLYWSQGNIQRLFYEDLGLSQAWSSFIAVVGSFVYALAWVPLTLWTYRVMVWRFSPRQLVVAFACWVFVYGHVPLLHALLGSDACFNQRTGAPMKWFVEGANGEITLFDSGGFDTTQGAEKRPVTSDICARFARQKVNSRPRRITASVGEIEFFDPNSGRARVWYSKTADGNYELFDIRGFNPATSEPLLPVTKDVVAEIVARATTEAEQARKRTEAEDVRRRVEAEQIRKHAEVAEAQRRIELEAARLKSAPASAAASYQCPGKVQVIMLTDTWTEVNPGSRCRLVASLPPEPEIDGLDWQGSFKTNIGYNSRNPEKLRVLRGTAQLKYSLCPLEAEGELNWNCTARGH